MMGMSSVQEIPIDRIKMPKFSLRPLDQTKVNELVQSIRNQGLLQPITVRPVADGFELVFGLHRLEAYKKLAIDGPETIAAYVRSVNDTDAFLMAEIENLQRNEYVDALKEGEGFSFLLKEGMTEKEIGEKISRTQQYVSSRLQLLTLDSDTRFLISFRLIPPEHGLELSKVQDVRKRKALATLCRKDRDGCLNLQQLREAAKKPLEELAVDPQVELLLLKLDPAWGIKRLESRLAKVESEQTSLRQEIDAEDVGLTPRVDHFEDMTSTLVVHGVWKCDHCTHNSRGVCQWWQFSRQITKWNMVQDGDKWRLRVSEHPEYCATCPAYERKA